MDECKPLIAGQVLSNANEFVLPWLQGRKPNAKKVGEREAKLLKRAKKAYARKHTRSAMSRAQHLAIVPGGVGAGGGGDGGGAGATGAGTAGLLASVDLVGRCKLNLSNPRCNRLEPSA